MIHCHSDPLTESRTEAIVNPINCMGWLESGPMLAVRDAFPENFIAYRRACRLRRIKVGQMFVVPLAPGRGPEYIINFPVKKSWRRPARLEDVEKGLDDLVRTCGEWGIRSVSIPALGSEPGGPSWDEVKWPILKAFAIAPEIDVRLYPPEAH